MKLRIHDLLRSAPWRSALILLGLVGLFGWAWSYRAYNRGWGTLAAYGADGFAYITANGIVAIRGLDGDISPISEEVQTTWHSIGVDFLVGTAAPFQQSGSQLAATLGNLLPAVRTDYRIRFYGKARSDEDFFADRKLISDYAREHKVGLNGSWTEHLFPEILQEEAWGSVQPSHAHFSEAILRAPFDPSAASVSANGTVLSNPPVSWIVSTTWHRAGIAASILLVLAPLPVLVLAVWIAVRWRIGWLSLVRSRRNECPRCGYQLAGLSGDSCPECGAAIHPAKTA